MKRTFLRLAPLAVLLLGACSYNVSVREFTAPDKLPPAEAWRVSKLFLVLQVPPADDPHQSALGQVLGVISAFSSGKSDKDLHRPLTRLEMEEFARRSAALLVGPAVNVEAFQVMYSSGAPPWFSDFAPSGSLWLEPGELSVRQDEREEKVKTSGGGEATEKRWSVHGDFSMRWRFYAEPGHTMLAEGSIAGLSFDQDRGTDHAKDLDDVLKAKLWDLTTGFGPALRLALLPHEVQRTRSIGRGKDRLRDAYNLLKNGDWDGAVRMWKSLTASDPGNWEPYYNLGVNEERQENYAEAGKDYKLALDRAQGGDRKKVQSILDELGRLMAPPSAPAAASATSFYRPALAVLPFSNQTVDLRAHDYLRLKVFELLAQRGYNVLPLTKIDENLRNHDIEEGGQLNLLVPPKLAAAVEADRILYGDVEEFKVVNVGVFYKRQVRLTLKLLDRSGHELWETTAQTVVQSGVKPKEAAASFLVHLADTTLQKVAKTYLKDESDETVRRALETLPRPIPGA